VVLCLAHQAFDSSLATFVNNVCYLFDFAAGEGFNACPDASSKPDGMYGIPNNQLARGKAFGVQTVHFIPRETRNDCHRSST
jgi:hypothetical protein